MEKCVKCGKKAVGYVSNTPVCGEKCGMAVLTDVKGIDFSVEKDDSGDNEETVVQLSLL